LLPTCVVLIQAARLEVEPSTGDRSLVTWTADSLVLSGSPSPVNCSALAPMWPATHVGLVAPTSVPVLPPTESAAVVPAPASK
jgi:hypothetical protein